MVLAVPALPLAVRRRAPSAPAPLVAFDGACLREKCDADHELGYQLMRRFAASAIERLQATRLQLLDVYANPAAR